MGRLRSGGDAIGWDEAKKTSFSISLALLSHYCHQICVCKTPVYLPRGLGCFVRKRSEKKSAGQGPLLTYGPAHQDPIYQACTSLDKREKQEEKKRSHPVWSTCSLISRTQEPFWAPAGPTQSTRFLCGASYRVYMHTHCLTVRGDGLNIKMNT